MIQTFNVTKVTTKKAPRKPERPLAIAYWCLQLDELLHRFVGTL